MAPHKKSFICQVLASPWFFLLIAFTYSFLHVRPPWGFSAFLNSILGWALGEPTIWQRLFCKLHRIRKPILPMVITDCQLTGRYPSFLSAYDSGVAGGILSYKSFQQDFDYSSMHHSKVSSLTVGLEQVGSFIVALFIYPLTNKYGRKITIIGSTALFVIGVNIQVINTHSLAAWYVGRVVAGLRMGGQSIVIPMYSAEMTPKEIRGRRGSFYQWLYTWGVSLPIGLTT